MRGKNGNESHDQPVSIKPQLHINHCMTGVRSSLQSADI